MSSPVSLYAKMQLKQQPSVNQIVMNPRSSPPPYSNKQRSAYDNEQLAPYQDSHAQDSQAPTWVASFWTQAPDYPKLTSDSSNDIVIAVMGITGAGKTTFIQHFCRQDLNVGHGLQSCKSCTWPSEVTAPESGEVCNALLLD